MAICPRLAVEGTGWKAFPAIGLGLPTNAFEPSAIAIKFRKLAIVSKKIPKGHLCSADLVLGVPYGGTKKVPVFTSNAREKSNIRLVIGMMDGNLSYPETSWGFQ